MDPARTKKPGPMVGTAGYNMALLLLRPKPALAVQGSHSRTTVDVEIFRGPWVTAAVQGKILGQLKDYRRCKHATVPSNALLIKQ